MLLGSCKKLSATKKSTYSIKFSRIEILNFVFSSWKILKIIANYFLLAEYEKAD